MIATLKLVPGGVTLARMQSQGEHGAVHLELGIQAVKIAWSERGLVSRIHFCEAEPADLPGARSAPAMPARVIRLAEGLRAYFERGAPISSVSWDDIDLENWTEFQKKVYSATTAIPHGETRSYGWVAKRIGKPAGGRAVGQALGRNPVPLLVPCHRVVSGAHRTSDDSGLGGFMGEDRPDAPELQLKRKLLELEDRFVNPRFPLIA